MKETLLVGVSGLEAKVHKTDDVWFMYLTAPTLGYDNEQLLFETKRKAVAWFTKLNKIYQKKLAV